MASFRAAIRPGTSNPSEATLAARSLSVSSKLMSTPGSPCSVAPLTRNVMPNRVLPQPAPPQNRLGRPGRQATERDLVETQDAGQGLRQLGLRLGSGGCGWAMRHRALPD